MKKKNENAGGILAVTMTHQERGAHFQIEVPAGHSENDQWLDALGKAFATALAVVVDGLGPPA